MYSDDIAAYAELLVSMVGLEKGQNLEIRGEPVHWDLMNEIAAAAYRGGARFVRAQAAHPGLLKARVEYSEAEYLDYVPSHVAAMDNIIIDEKWALIAVRGPEDPDFFADVDTERNARMGRAFQQAGMRLRRALQAEKFQWLVAAAPTDKWAQKVLGDGASGADEFSVGAGAAGVPSETAETARDRLWDIAKPILRLDQDAPVAAWKEQSRRLKQRARRLEELHPQWLHFEGPGTDLWVAIPDRAVWLGGPATTPEGIEFLPNLPTEEVFTAPDCRRTTGRVAVTRPVTVMNKVVDGAWFVFEEGKVVEFGAEKNAEVLERYLEMDEGAAYAGEIALVDSTSPVFASGKVFYNILFDENASCHLALGGAYPGCIKGGSDLSDADLSGHGLNVSFVHTDFMIGSDEVDVTATAADGREAAVLRDGRFAL